MCSDDESEACSESASSFSASDRSESSGSELYSEPDSDRPLANTSKAKNPSKSVSPASGKTSAVTKKHRPEKKRQSKPGLKTPPVICYSSYFSGCSLHYISYRVFLQSAGAGNRRKSIKESNFAAQHADLLKPIYKYYQAMQFSTYGADFQWEANCRSRCVLMLLDAAKVALHTEKYNRFKKAVMAEFVEDTPRYSPLRLLMIKTGQYFVIRL